MYRMAVMGPDNPPSPLCLLKSLHSVLFAGLSPDQAEVTWCVHNQTPKLYSYPVPGCDHNPE